MENRQTKPIALPLAHACGVMMNIRVHVQHYTSCGSGLMNLFHGFYNILHLCRSTVEFAREVSEAKAMDDTVNKLEQMFSGGGESPAAAPRRGTSPTTINWGNSKKQEVCWPPVLRLKLADGMYMYVCSETSVHVHSGIIYITS